MEAPPASDKAPRSRRIPLGFLGAIVMVAVVEGFIHRRAPLFEQAYAEEWRYTAQAAVEQAPGSRILCFGDSLVKTGVAPLVIEWELGIPTYNLAASGSQVPVSYYMLERALEAGTKPEAVILDCKWTALASSYDANSRLLPEVFGPREFFQIAREAEDVGLFMNLLVARFSTSFKARREIRESVLAALQGDTRGVAHNAPLLRRNWIVNRGGSHPQPNPDYQGECNLNDPKLLNPNWSAQHVNIVYLERFLKLTARNGIPVFLVMMPLSPNLQAQRDEIGADESYREFLLKAVHRFDHVVVVDGRSSAYDASVFVDPTHLNHKGAAIFSSNLARLLRPILAGRKPEKAEERWVALPKFNEKHRVGIALESVYDSALAIGWEPLPKRR